MNFLNGNNRDTRKMEDFGKKIVSIALTFGAKVYGGYVRDMLRGDPFSNIDLMFEFNGYNMTDENRKKMISTVNKFIEMLSIVYQTKVIKSKKDGFYDYTDIILEVKDNWYKTKVNIKYVDTNSTVMNLDFDVNMLVMSKKGIEVLPQYEKEKQTLQQHVSLIDIIQQIQIKQFDFVVPEKKTVTEHLDTFSRIQNMINKNWSLKGSTCNDGRSLDFFELQGRLIIGEKRKHNSDVEYEQPTCLVCTQETKLFYETNCGHSCCIKCIENILYKSVEEQRDIKCFMCRAILRKQVEFNNDSIIVDDDDSVEDISVLLE